MDRNTRTLVVLLVAVLTASGASYAVYQAIRHAPVREVPIAHSYVVAASRTVPAGSRLAEADLKIVPWPDAAKVAGSFDKIEPVVNRAVMTQVLENEPVTESKLVPPEGGAGLPPTIPPGMRAISVSVNEVVGVA